jgi:hypothetical protein
MILVECSHCGRRELRGYRAIAVFNTAAGIELAWACRACGRRHVEHTGQHADPPHTPLIAA